MGNFERGIFGWSCPAGSSDYTEAPCPLCGKMSDDCECPICECGVTACLEHMDKKDLVAQIRLKSSQLYDLEHEAKRRERKLPPCPACGTVHTVSVVQDFPSLCCNYEYWRDGWQKELALDEE